MKLIIAEKPALARDITRVICGAKEAHLPASGQGYTVAACLGHMLELLEPAKIDSAWDGSATSGHGAKERLAALPIAPNPWPKVVATGKEAATAQISALLKDADSVIHAGDPDDEGQLIVDELLDFFGYTGPVKRVYINDSLDDNIARAFTNLIDNDLCKGNGNAALARQIADFTFGVNESRLATLRLKKNISIGRVQTPTLGLVVMRDAALSAHRCREFYELAIDGEVSGIGTVPFKLKADKSLIGEEKHLYDRAVLEDALAKVKGSEREATTTVADEIEPPPLPYSLTELQQDMNKRHKLSIATTQQITQDLRDRYHAITYNRTDCRYLKDEHFTEARAVLDQALANISSKLQLDFSLRSAAFDDESVSTHHAIIPQKASVDISRLSVGERQVYEAITLRYAMQFLPPKKSEVSTTVIQCAYGELVFRTKRTIDAGFSAVFAMPSPDAQAESGEVWIEDGVRTVSIAGGDVLTKKTTPPKAYTEATLLFDMTSIAKYVTDPAIKATLLKKDAKTRGEHGGIGTTATRATIISTLVKRGFISLDAGKVTSTALGREVYYLIPNDIKGADLTAKWWLQAEGVREGKADPYTIQRSVVDVFNAHKDSAYVGTTLSSAYGAKSIGVCPVCGDALLAYKSLCSCASNVSEKQDDGSWVLVSGCGFKLFYSAFGKTLSDTQIKELIGRRKTTQKVKGLRAKSGKTFEARLALQADDAGKPTGRVIPVFDDAPRQAARNQQITVK